MIFKVGDVWRDTFYSDHEQSDYGDNLILAVLNYEVWYLTLDNDFRKGCVLVDSILIIDPDWVQLK